MKNKFKVGDEVYWTDPDDDISSGYYKVIAVINRGIYYISDGTSEAEVFEHELNWSNTK